MSNDGRIIRRERECEWAGAPVRVSGSVTHNPLLEEESQIPARANLYVPELPSERADIINCKMRFAAS